MASWNEPRYPPRTSSRMPGPGIFISVEFGVSFCERDGPHTASMKYTSRNMQERLARQRRQQEEHLLQARNHHQSQSYPQEDGQHPSILMPAPYQERQSRHNPQHRPRRQIVRARDSHPERGSSAPPTLSDRTQATSPISPVATPGIQHTSSMPLAFGASSRERPLPEVPSRYRLGEDGLPWTTEPWYIPPEPYATPTLVGIELENIRGEDPQRVRDLEALHQAMMTVDSLPPGHDGWETWTWESVGDMPRGPRSIGWAVSTDDVRSPDGVAHLQPPPYVVSQWEMGSGGLRPRSSG